MIAVDRISKIYPLYAKPADRLIELLPFVGPRHHPFAALRDVCFEVGAGECFALVGPNGSGKSTLLQIVAGIVQPTSGTVRVDGRVAALLELGAGFNPEFTGRENVRLNAELKGLTPAQIEAALPVVEAFAEIGPFLDRPVKEYSSGMYVRLAFATAILGEPEVLIIDEALAVGDVRFANRCIRKLEELRARGTTILFVSHDLGIVKRLADRAALLIAGAVDFIGTPTAVADRYVGMVLSPAEIPRLAARRHGDGASEILAAELRNERGEAVNVLRPGEVAIIEVHLRFYRRVENPMVGILIRNRLGFDVAGTNTRLAGLLPGAYEAGEEARVEFRFICSLTRQAYTVTIASQYADGTSQDWRDDYLSFSVADARDLAGVVDLNATIEWTRLGRASSRP